MTQYTFCIAADHYAYCRMLQVLWHPEWTAEDEQQLRWPTVMAWRKGQCVGFLGTFYLGNMVVAGPLAILPSIRQKGPLAHGLICRYDRLLTDAGMTHYYFYIDVGNPWQHVVERSGTVERIYPSGVDPDRYAWYQKELSHGQLSTKISRAYAGRA